VKVRDLNMKAKTFGVGGTSAGDYVLFDTIEIGGYTIKNVIAHVHTDNDFTLIGVDFFDKFGNVEWNRNQSTLTLTRDKK
jgi:predicted aspartyl protease